MKENILIESKTKFVKRLGVVTAISLLISFISLIVKLIVKNKIAAIDHEYEMNWVNLTAEQKAYWGNLWHTVKITNYIFIIFGIIGIILLLYYLYCHKMKLVVTDKRVYGKSAFGKQVDLPLDSISAVGMCFYQGISIGTSSGRISFLGIDNRNEIHKVISGLLIERQEKQKTTPEPAPVVHHSDADELGKYKNLLDDGVITQAEFDAKKKQILGL